MKKFLLYIFLVVQSCMLISQDWISIIGKSPYPSGTKVYFTGFNGFEKIDLGSVRSNTTAEIDFFTDYQGYCVMSAEGAKSYPLILEHDPVCIEWGNPPAFTCEPENEFFYRYKSELREIEAMQSAFFSMPDTLPAKDSILQELGREMESLYEELMNEEALNARVFLLSELFIIQCRMADSTEQMLEWKDDLMTFTDTHFGILNSSVYLSRLAQAYVGMNEKVLHSELGIMQAMEYDVASWVEKFGNRLNEQKIVEFFALHFVRTGQAEVASKLVGKYINSLKCDQYVGSTPRPANMPYTFNVFFGPNFSNVRSLDQFQGMDKILVFVSTECPASVFAAAGLYDFVSAKQIRMPVILVPDYELEGELGVLVEEKAPFSLRTGYKYGGPLMQGAGVKQLPAFMLLDRQNLVKEIYYDLELLKEQISR